jgi:hypothetical protein
MDLSSYIPEKQTDAIDIAIRCFQLRDDLWTFPLIFSLTDNISTHAVVWDERCVRRLLLRTHSPNRERLVQDMETLSEMRRRLATRDEIGTCARQIWYRDSSRDYAQTAVSQLYGAVADQLYPAGRLPVLHFGVGTRLIVSGEEFPEWALSTAIDEYEFVKRNREAGTLPSAMLNLVGADHYGFREPGVVNV